MKKTPPLIAFTLSVLLPVSLLFSANSKEPNIRSKNNSKKKAVAKLDWSKVKVGDVYASKSAPAGKFSFAADMDEKGYLFVQVGDSEAVSSQTGGHWISKWPAEDLSVGFDHGSPVDTKSPKEKFKGKLLKLSVMI